MSDLERLVLCVVLFLTAFAFLLILYVLYLLYEKIYDILENCKYKRALVKFVVFLPFFLFFCFQLITYVNIGRYIVVYDQTMPKCVLDTTDGSSTNGRAFFDWDRSDLVKKEIIICK